MTNPPSNLSSTLAEAEVEELEDILEDLSDGDNDSDDHKKTTKIIAMTMMTRKIKKLS